MKDYFAHLFSLDYILSREFIPLQVDSNHLRIAVSEANCAQLIDEIQFMTDRKVEREVWTREKISLEMEKRYGISGSGPEDSGNQPFLLIERNSSATEILSDGVDDDHQIIRQVNEFISRAIMQRASDIHVENYDSLFRIRFRIDGKLIEQPPPEKVKPLILISRLKIMANLDIAEKRRPQDGRIRVKNERKTVDIRVSTMPTEFGEKVVLRILDKTAQKLSLDSLGFSHELLLDLKKILRQPYGMILVTGPTGSGKTTTLYSALNFINHPSRNIISIEDPIEYNLTGINQTRVRPELGLGFAAILRTILRQDPNVIMVGEIRDRDTAEIAVRAALTGHLVLSTLHTNDALSTIIRMQDMGVESFLLTHSLKMVLAQRLIRKICPRCKTREQPEKGQGAENFPPLKNLSKAYYRGKGCESCHFTGYSRRTVIAEHFIMDENLSTLILRNTSLSELRANLLKKGYKTLQEDGLAKASSGQTSLDEVLRETVSL
jgi:type IV pilus assembly protein PilB